MARRVRDTRLETRTARLKLPIAKRPIFVSVGRGISLGYRRNKKNGTWTYRTADGHGGKGPEMKVGVADDYVEADGKVVLDYWQAQDLVHAITRGERPNAANGPITIGKALDQYEANLKVRGGDVDNVRRVRIHLPETLSAKSVALVTSRDFRAWRDELAANRVPATVNRIAAGFRAALNLLAEHDDTIVNRRAWETGLAPIRGANEARNVILSEPVIRAIISAAQTEGEEFGLLVEVSAVTGARASQIARLEVQDLQDARADPRVMMPASRKGGGEKKITRRPVPIPVDLALRLREVANTRNPDARLLLKEDGAPWQRGNHRRAFARAVKAAGLNPDEVTIYALRHSNIVRQLLAGVPVRVVAVNHDTSIVMIERTYSRHIGDHADALARVALLDITAPSGGNVVQIGAAR
jgi:integrase